ncbi:MAG: 3-oxoacyl-ACP synthase [Bacteroidaceae bacterium]|nr:3-oxoacyl-ACP synthase [Bacteroidaceae bacterium]
MIGVVATNITSPLGMSSAENYQAVKRGMSKLRRYEGYMGVPEPFFASLFTTEQIGGMAVEGFTRFESMVLHSVRDALSYTSLDVGSERVVFILASTKGNVGEDGCEGDELGVLSQKIADELGINTMPIVVCNACISGLSAQVLALRLLESEQYDYAIVCGADCQSRFIVSGFQSLKALSDVQCRPFDDERLGLNLGEAASTIIFSRFAGSHDWKLKRGAVRNDAFHISGPHPKGEGCYRALSSVLDGYDINQLASIGVHGTATMYNDQMESKAIERAGLSQVPLSALKGYFGHTMGAAGVLESVIMMMSLDDELILPSRGFSEIGVSGKVTISGEVITTDKKAFVKILSGFGGCNGAILFDKKDEESVPAVCEMKEAGHVVISRDRVEVNGKDLAVESSGKAMLTDLYKSLECNYPKYYKMDMLSRLAFISCEMLLEKMPSNDSINANTAVILFNHSSAILSDRAYKKTISDAENYYPSPSVFVYTLPNISTGEICIRHHLNGESSFFILPSRDDEKLKSVVDALCRERGVQRVIYGWIDCPDEESFEADVRLLEKGTITTF